MRKFVLVVGPLINNIVKAIIPCEDALQPNITNMSKNNDGNGWRTCFFFHPFFFKHSNSPLFSNSAVILDVMDKCDTIFLYCSWKPGTTLSGSVVCQGFTLKFPPLKWDKHVLSRNFGRRRESAYGPWCRTAEFAWHDINGRTRRRRAEGGEAQNKCFKNFLVIRPTSLPVCPFTSSWVAIRSTLKCRRFLHHR